MQTCAHQSLQILRLVDFEFHDRESIFVLGGSLLCAVDETVLYNRSQASARREYTSARRFRPQHCRHLKHQRVCTCLANQ